MLEHHTSNDYMAHGFCFAWEQGLVWLHVVSDIVTGLAYYSIPIAMFYFIFKRRDLPFYRMFLLFGIFILSCGTTHFFAAYTIFDPLYWQEGWVKAFTAVVSALSAVLFIPMIPRAIALPSLTKAMEEIKDLNVALAKQVDELQESEERFRSVVNNIPIGVTVIDPDMKVISVNPQMTKWYRELDISDQPSCFKVFNNPPGEGVCDYCPVSLTLKDGEVHEALTDTPSPEGTKHYRVISSPIKDAAGKVIAAIELVEDNTESKKFEAQLRHAQKMESIGTLAGGVAHDFNNILTAIIGFASLLEMKMVKDDPLTGNVHQILAAADRAATLTQSLLAFSRKTQLETKPVNLNDIIYSVEKLLQRLLREDIEFRCELTGDDLAILADPAQLEQVLINLAANARDAMPKGGLLRIGTSAVELDRKFIKVHGYGEPGRYALLTCSDNGVGVDKETALRIFEPFFTTKGVGEGTGLGLSIVYGIIKQHKGYINCYSEPGRGTTFQVYLPLTELTPKEESKAAETPPRGGTETILVAEDDAAARSLIRQILETVGYKVVEAVDGDDAIAKFIACKDQVHLVILDVIMPKRNGKEAFKEILELRPGLKCLFTSGYSADILDAREKEELNFVPKPIIPSMLLKKIREVLDE